MLQSGLVGFKERGWKGLIQWFTSGTFPRLGCRAGTPNGPAGAAAAKLLEPRWLVEDGYGWLPLGRWVWLVLVGGCLVVGVPALRSAVTQLWGAVNWDALITPVTRCKPMSPIFLHQPMISSSATFCWSFILNNFDNQLTQEILHVWCIFTIYFTIIYYNIILPYITKLWQI